MTRAGGRVRPRPPSCRFRCDRGGVRRLAPVRRPILLAAMLVLAARREEAAATRLADAIEPSPDETRPGKWAVLGPSRKAHLPLPTSSSHDVLSNQGRGAASSLGRGGGPFFPNGLGKMAQRPETGRRTRRNLACGVRKSVWLSRHPSELTSRP